MFLVTKNRYALLILLFFITIKVSSVSLPILERLSPNVIQYRSDCYMSGWSCGFVVLNNAQQIEHMVTGRKIEPMTACRPILEAKNINPRKSTSSSMRVMCNDAVTHLPEFHSLGILTDGSVSLVAEKIDYKYSFTTRATQCSVVSKYDKHSLSLRHDCVAPWHLRTNVDKVQSFADAQWKKQIDSYFEKMRKTINDVDHTGKPVVFHFDCTLWPAEKHCILLSVVKKPNQKPYVVAMDNLNHSMMKNNIRKKMVQFLERQFCITALSCRVSKKRQLPSVRQPQPQAMKFNVDRLTDHQLDQLKAYLRQNSHLWRLFDLVLLQNLLG